MGTLTLQGGVWVFGADSGGATLDSITPDSYDLTDGSWSLYDPDGCVDTTYGTNGATHSSGVNLVKFNSVTPASSNDFNWGASGDHRAPRYYRLFKINNQQMVYNDKILFRFTMEWDGVTNDFNQRIVTGLCQDPTALPPDTIAGAGGLFEKNSTGSSSLVRPIYGGWSHDTVYSISNTGQVSAIAVGERGATYTSGVYFQAYNSSGEQNGTATGLRGGHYGLTLSGNLYEMVGFGTRSNSQSFVAGHFCGIKISLTAVGIS